MKAAFMIERLPTYSLFSPIIDAMLGRGWDVECWHDYGQAEGGLKGYQHPSMDVAPRFRNGQAVLRTYRGRAELAAMMEASGSVDAVVSTQTARPSEAMSSAGSGPLWIGLQHVVDSFLNHTPDQVLTCDVIAMYSQWWSTWVGEYYEAAGLVEDGAAYSRQLAARAAFVGLPEIDAARMIDPEEVRRRWGISAHQPVVVLFPFPQGVGQAGFWPQKIYAEPSRLKQAVNVVARRRFEYTRDVWHGWNDRRVVQAIRRFCDRNGACLIVKSRRKTPIPAYLEAVADRCLYDEALYPPTILEALSIASLSFSHYSGSVLESVGLGVPHICVPFDVEDYAGAEQARRRHLSRLLNTEEGGQFQFRGVSTAMSAPEVLDDLPGRTLDDFAMDRGARDRYIERFLSHDVRDGGSRTVDAIDRAVSARRIPSARGPS
jgi:hypothetical protein